MLYRTLNALRAFTILDNTLSSVLTVMFMTLSKNVKYVASSTFLAIDSDLLL